MKEGPDIALVGTLIGDPGRANMLTALMSGKALTATELAAEAGITPQTASSHLARLTDGGLTRLRKQGRHRYYSLADDDVGALLEAMMGVAMRGGHTRTRTGPKDPALRRARVCYDHLAGELAVQMADSLRGRGLVREVEDRIELTGPGTAFMQTLGIDPSTVGAPRRPFCRPCLDWSARRTHLAGSLGAALFTRFDVLGWMKRMPGSRVVTISRTGENAFQQAFPK